MARKGPLNKLVNAAFDAVKDPVGATGKTLGVAKEAVAIGRMLVGQVTQLAVDKATETVGGSSAESSPTQEPDETAASLRSVPPVKRPGDAARDERPAPPVPAQSSDPATTGAPVKKSPAKKPPAKKAPAKAEGDPTMVTPADIAETMSVRPAKKAAKKAPAKKSAAQAPVTKATAQTPVKKAPAKKAAAKKAPAKKAAAKKAPARKATPATVAKNASARKSAKKTTRKTTRKTAEQVANADGPALTTPVGTSAAAEATNPDTTDHDLQQPGTEPIVDPGTAKAIRSESQTLQRAADPDKR